MDKRQVKALTEYAAAHPPETKQEHTPGPWRVAGHDNGRQELPIFATDLCLTIAVIRDHGRLADARLIAAAPELLAACRAAESFLAEHVEDTDFDSTLGDLLRAAIARAEGGAHASL